MKRIYLLREIDREEGNPPPVLAVLKAHIGEPPVFPGTPLPSFPPEVAMAEPDSPYASQKNSDLGPPPVIMSQRVSGVVMH